MRRIGRPPAHMCRSRRQWAEVCIAMNYDSHACAEVDLWRDSPSERPAADSVSNIVNKLSDARVFLDCVRRHRNLFKGAKRILELGGGQGWASCLVKRLRPGAEVTLTDISPYAIASAGKWERIWDVNLDEQYACPGSETHETDNSVDLVFCFASAHHFTAMPETLAEIRRILKISGTAAFFHEPTCPRAWYPLARRRVRRKRPEAGEDVLVPGDLRRFARSAGLTMEVDYYPTLLYRRPREVLYYGVLSKVPALRRVLPCGANILLYRDERRAGDPENG